MTKRSVWVGVGCLAALSAWLAAASAAELQLSVIVNSSRARPLSIAEVRAIFLKQQLLWGDGQPIVPVNLVAESETREAFSLAVFGQSSRRLAAYWNRRYFEAGEFPPPTLASEEAVLRFVASNSNAIGYVATTNVDDSVAVALVLPSLHRSEPNSEASTAPHP